MSNFEMFINAVSKPITEASILAAIASGIILGILYWNKIKVSIYNGILFNIAFFSAMYSARRFVDGISSAGGYIGLFLLYLMFIFSSYTTKTILAKIKKERS